MLICYLRVPFLSKFGVVAGFGAGLSAYRVFRAFQSLPAGQYNREIPIVRFCYATVVMVVHQQNRKST